MGGRINTIMQTCFFAISGVLPSEEAIAADQEGDREDLRQEGRRGGAEELRGHRPDAGQPARGGGARAASTSRFSLPPIVPDKAPDFVQAGHGGDDGGQGRPAAGLAPSRWTAPGRPAPRGGRSATSPPRSRSGTEGSASSATSARWSARTPPSAPRSTTRRSSTARRARSSRSTSEAAEFKGCEVHHPGRARGLHRLHAVRDGLPGQGQVQPAAQGDQHAPAAARCATRSATTTTSSSSCPRPTARKVRARREGRAVPPAAVRVLRRLRRLRRDAVHQAADPALRRPRADRQRHRLLVDLRRQPADDAVLHRTPNGRGPAWANSLFEDNAEFGLGFRLAVDKHARAGARAARAARRSAAARPGRRICSTADQSTEAGIAAQRAARRRAAQAMLRRSLAEARRLDAARRLPGRRRASGSSAATAGRTTSATAASTTCCRSAATSTSWCSTPRSTPTPAASRPRPRRIGAAAKFAAAGKARPKKDLGLMAMSYGNVYVAASPSAPRTRRR